MLRIFAKIRHSMMGISAVKSYLLYALGEILLVMIGILLALQVNNWNENRKSRNAFIQTVLGLAEDIRNDTSIIQSHISNLEIQGEAARLIIPILENRELIVDTGAFYTAFLAMSDSRIMDLNTEIWDDMRKSGSAKAYGNPYLISRIQNYYREYNGVARNWDKESVPRIEMRGLKYELMDQTDLDKMRVADESNLPGQKALKAIFNEKRVVQLTKRISFTSSLFISHFTQIETLANEVLELIEDQYGPAEREHL